jgi:N-acetylglucosaminyl-diphospho-decaprenol L-rhamnosyltransferase
MTPARCSSSSTPQPVLPQAEQPEVSVCIVNWNCRDMLAACLWSLREESQSIGLEVVLVDNGSSDGAADMVADTFPEVVLIRNSYNASFSAANNQAASRARGEFLFFLNNDTLVPPGALRRLLDYARTHPEAGIVGPRLRDGTGAVQVSCRMRPSLGSMLHRLACLRWTGLFRASYQRFRCRALMEGREPRPVDVLMGAALFMSRRVFDDCGPWDEDYLFGGEDLDLCTQVARRYHVVYHPDIEITHFGRVSSRQHIGYAFSQTVIGHTRYLRKSGCPAWGLLFYKLAFTVDAPLRWLVLTVQYILRRLRRQPIRAAKDWLVLRGLSHFMAHDLPAFWKL